MSIRVGIAEKIKHSQFIEIHTHMISFAKCLFEEKIILFLFNMFPLILVLRLCIKKPKDVTFQEILYI